MWDHFFLYQNLKNKNDDYIMIPEILLRLFNFNTVFFPQADLVPSFDITGECVSALINCCGHSELVSHTHLFFNA